MITGKFLSLTAEVSPQSSIVCALKACVILLPDLFTRVASRKIGHSPR